MAFILEFEPVGLRLVCEEPLTIATAALQAGITIRAICGGKGTCCKCLVRLEGHTPLEPSTSERMRLSPEQLAQGWRLACRAVVAESSRIYIPPSSRIEEQVIQIEGDSVGFSPLPAVRLYLVKVEPPCLSDQASDFSRLERALHEQYNLSLGQAGLGALRQISQALRLGDWEACIALRGAEPVAAFPGSRSTPVGLAVDVGTTKLACYLVDLERGQVLAARGVMNPQIPFGEDVMSRLEAVLEDPQNAVRQQAAAVEALNTVATELCGLHGLTPEHLVDVCIVGNTAMHHLLLGLPVRPLAVAPFVPALSQALDIPAAEIGLKVAPGARLHLPAPIAGFVGSDHLAFLLAAGFGQDERTRLGIDIGTNTEIALQAHGQIVSCSTASGPAFEGAHISHGMRAAPGAIEHVTITEAGESRYEVIGDVPAVGVCGSGILDALAEMHRVGIINHRGRLQPGVTGIHQDLDGSLYYCLTSRQNGCRQVVITQEDIEQVLLAKGAIRAGIEILMDSLNVHPEQIDEVVIAGAFGSYLDPGNAVRIGLLPEVALTRIRALGNAAGAGARQMLASTAARQQAGQLARQIEYLELTVYPGFSRFFARGAHLPSSQIFRLRNKS